MPEIKQFGTKQEVGMAKIAFKFPMTKRVMDVRGYFYAYDFIDGKLQFIRIGSTYIDK